MTCLGLFSDQPDDSLKQRSWRALPAMLVIASNKCSENVL